MQHQPAASTRPPVPPGPGAFQLPTAPELVLGAHRQRGCLPGWRFQTKIPPGSLTWGAMAESLTPTRTPRTFSFKPARTHDTDHAPPALHSSPQTLTGETHKHKLCPPNSHDTRQPPHLCLSNPPSCVLPAPHYPPRLSEEVRSKERENAFARSLPSPALSLKQKRREEGGGWGGERKVQRDMGTTIRGAGEGAGMEMESGERGQDHAPRAAWRGRSLTCPGRCRC